MNAFCRTAPSDRRSLRAICRAGTVLAIDFSSRTSVLVHSRRVVFFLAAIVTTSCRYIKRLRRKFKSVDDGFDMIETLYGVGYRFKPAFTGSCTEFRRG